MHVYEWEPRMFKKLPPPISIPGSTNQWTHRMEPGISSFSDHLEVNLRAGGCLLSNVWIARGDGYMFTHHVPRVLSFRLAEGVARIGARLWQRAEKALCRGGNRG